MGDPRLYARPTHRVTGPQMIITHAVASTICAAQRRRRATKLSTWHPSGTKSAFAGFAFSADTIAKAPRNGPARRIQAWK